MSEIQKPLRCVEFLFAAILLFASMIAGAKLQNENGPTQITPQSLTTVPIPGPVQVVRFTLYDRGIYPHEARVSPGVVSIVIEDLSGSSTGLVVEREQADLRVLVGTVNRAADRLRARADLPLTAGRYELSDASRRSNKALLIVEP